MVLRSWEKLQGIQSDHAKMAKMWFQTSFLSFEHNSFWVWVPKLIFILVADMFWLIVMQKLKLSFYIYWEFTCMHRSLAIASLWLEAKRVELSNASIQSVKVQSNMQCQSSFLMILWKYLLSITVPNRQNKHKMLVASKPKPNATWFVKALWLRNLGYVGVEFPCKLYIHLVLNCLLLCKVAITMHSIFTRFFLGRIFMQGNYWDVLSSLAKNSIPCKTFCSLTTNLVRILEKSCLAKIERPQSFQ